MADMVTNLVEFKLRRDPQGVRVTVKSTPQFEASLKTRAGGQTSDRPAGGDYVPVYYIRESPTPCDADLGHFLYLIGSSGPEGKSVVIPLVRTRDQLVRVAEEVAAWVERHFAAYMRAIEVTASVRARSVFGLEKEA